MHHSKAKVNSSLGSSLLKEQRRKRQGGKHGDPTWLHSTDLDDGYDWGRLNLQSVTEESSLDEFLRTASLAGTEFTAERMNANFISSTTSQASLADEFVLRKKLEDDNEHLLKVPRRPSWTTEMTAEELNLRTQDAFLTWRRKLAELEKLERLTLTPFENNLEVWKQLWRVIERSNIVVQIVDARQPLLYRCEDLEQYVKEIDPEKVNALLINKSDFLSMKQRQYWAEYFAKNNVNAVFWSALLSTNNEKQPHNTEIEAHSSCTDESTGTSASIESENARIVDREGLLNWLKSLAPSSMNDEDTLTVGMVGYPNVGKSSTINALLADPKKKVPVSATPGKTKHFQTLYVDGGVCVCDCPGLVMPSFVSSQAEMIVTGILPVDQMRRHEPPVQLVCERIPRAVLESTYGVCLPRPREGEAQDRPPTQEELLMAYGYARGYMTANGQPDCPRSARYILKDYVNGKLLYRLPPPGVSREDYQEPGTSSPTNQDTGRRPRNPKDVRLLRDMKRATTEEVDSEFFAEKFSNLHVKSQKGVSPGVEVGGKPWKKHNNKNKKEKARRVFKHHDDEVN